MGQDKIRLIDELKRFKKENKISKIILFGSRVKDTFTRYSDVDLILISPKFKNVKTYKRASPYRLKWKLDFPVDLLCYTPEEFDKRKNEPTIVREALKRGIEI